jgi:hypothetical protein
MSISSSSPAKSAFEIINAPLKVASGPLSFSYVFSIPDVKAWVKSYVDQKEELE